MNKALENWGAQNSKICMRTQEEDLKKMKKIFEETTENFIIFILK